MRTRLTELLDIEHPVMLAGMGGVSYHRIVAAVSDAGGFGTLGASSMGMPVLKAEMAAVKELTDRPFGVDLLTAMPGDLEAQVRDIIAGGA
jgi:enoyl-[acyl-carrier protein] reductase II